MDPHHERRIVALALARGLITRDQLDRHGPDASAADTRADGASDRGPVLAALIDAGVLDEAAVAALADDAASMPDDGHTELDWSTAAWEATSTPAPARAAAPPLQDWDRFTILDFIGAGGMGRVFRAREQLLDRVVALKLIPALADAGEVRERLLELQGVS